MSATPTIAELLAVRSDLRQYLPAGRDLDVYQDQALAHVKRLLEDRRATLWTQVYDTDNDQYMDNPDGTGRNEDRIKHAINLATVAMVFRDYSVDSTDTGKWWGLAQEYMRDAEDVIMNARLDIDLDESGDIDDDEAGLTGQVYMRR